MFNLPRVVGKTEDGEEITADIGRFGPYIKIGKTFVSIKDKDPLTITEEEARVAFADKAAAAEKKVIAEFGEVKILNGPNGPYITDGKKNARIPKSQKPESITEAEAKEMLANAKPGKRRPRRRA
jgi:DNA topoisomerase-1